MKINEFIKDTDGANSSKRAIAFVFSVIFIIGFCLATFTSIVPPEYLMQDIVYIIGGALGFVGLERFGRK